MKSRPEKLQVWVGEYYADLIRLDSWINGRTRSAQAGSLLCAKIQEREGRILERLAYLANKRGLTADELRCEILNNKAGETEDSGNWEFVDDLEKSPPLPKE